MGERMNSSEFAELAAAAKDRLREFLTNDFDNDESIPAVRIAASVLASWTRYEQTQSAREASGFMMARELAQNPEQFRKYLSVACPNVPLAEMIEDKRLSSEDGKA